MEEKEPEEVESNRSGGGGGWGGWGISSFSMLSDLQKAASVAAEEFSRNAAAMAKDAVSSFSDFQTAGSDSDSVKDDGENATGSLETGSDHEKDAIRKSVLDKLEKAGEDSSFGQGLKVLDTTVETFASGAWNALGSAWKSRTEFVEKLEHSASIFAGSIQEGDVPVKGGAILESGKILTAKGMEMLERVGKEAMELFISETGLKVDHKIGQFPDEQLEEVTFDRCFYIYGGPDHLEELEALSNHYALLFNRRKAKLLSEQKLFYDGKLKEVQKIFGMSSTAEDICVELDKGKTIEATETLNGNELKILRDASVAKAADMAAGFTAALGGLAANEITQRAERRLDGIHSEGIHRLSEMCCSAISHLVVLGKSVVSNSNKSDSEDILEDSEKIDWPEDSTTKAKIIRSKAQVMTGDVEAVSNGFVTGISDIIEAYASAIKGASANADDTRPTSVQEKAQTVSELILTSKQSALDKIQDALQFLAYVVLSTSLPAA